MLDKGVKMVVVLLKINGVLVSDIRGTGFSPTALRLKMRACTSH